MRLEVRDHHHRILEIERLAREGRHHRARWLECRVGVTERVVLVPDPEKAAVVRVLPVPAGTLAPAR